MYIRRKVFSILNTEVGERLFSTTDYILDQREFTGETKRRNKALKRQWLEKMGEADGYLSKDSLKETLERRGKSQKFINKIDLDTASKIREGRFENQISQNSDELAWKERKRRNRPDSFKHIREWDKQDYKNKKSRKTVPQSPKPTTPNPEVVVVPEKALVVSNQKPVVKTESKLSKLAKNKYAKGAAGLLVLGGTAAGGYYLLNKKKNKKDKEDKDK